MRKTGLGSFAIVNTYCGLWRCDYTVDMTEDAVMQHWYATGFARPWHRVTNDERGISTSFPGAWPATGAIIRPTTKGIQMKVEVYVAGVAREVWFRETRDERQVSVLNCLDRTAHEGLKLKQTFDYSPSKEEEEAIDLDKLDGANLVLAVEEIKAANGGRLKFKGKIDRASVPKQALRNNGGGGAPAKTPAAH